jgi:hypothetical protein
MAEDKGEPVELLSRFADPDATEEVDLGVCRCPGAPHERDSAQIRTDIGDGEAKSVRVAGWQSTGMEYYDFEVANDAAIAKFTLSWTLCEKDGEPVAITRRTVSLLDEATRIVLLMAINKPFEERHGGALPNASGARSRSSSPASAPPNRAARRRR